MGIRGSGEQVAFAVAGDRAVIRLGRPLTDRNGVADLALTAVEVLCSAHFDASGVSYADARSAHTSTLPAPG